jgi:hypothetical protein
MVQLEFDFNEKEKQQTAVDWLFTTLDNILELYPSEWSKVSKAVEEAKQKHTKQNTHN